MEPPPSSSIGDEEDIDMEQAMRGKEQSIEEKKNLASSEQTLPNRQCRICYAPEEASGADPILLRGCTCKDDISYGHQSCLKKWFRMRFQRNGNLDCEVCRSPLGARLKEIIRSFIIAEVIQHAPRLLLLLEVPPHDLDHLQVPLETPGFYQLPSETQRSLEASFERLEQEQRRGQSRRREAFETAQLQAIAEDGDGDHVNRLRLEDVLVNDFLELWEFHDLQLDPSHSALVARVFIEHPNPHIHTLDQTEGEDTTINPIGAIGYPEGPVVRVPILRPQDRVHPSSVEDLLDEVSRQAVQVVDLFGEDLVLLPNFMDTIYLEVEEPLLMTPVREVQDNVDDDIPIAIPVLDNPSSAGGPDGVFAEFEAARPADSIPRRVYTYGRFQMFQLLQ